MYLQASRKKSEINSEINLEVISEIHSEKSHTLLQYGDKGEEVKYLQKLLKEKLYLWEDIDGIFGKNTKDAIKTFQRDNGIIADGKVGQKTWDNLENPSVKRPTKINAIVTAYCPCIKCCDKTDGITASQVPAVQGRTLAAPKTYPFGTKIIIDGVEYIVEDRGGAIKDNKFDMFFYSHQEAKKYGVNKTTVEIIFPTENCKE